jgi:hypothetical protein
MDIRQIDNLAAFKASSSRKAKPTGEFGEIYSQKLAAISKADSPDQLEAKKALIDHSSRILDLLDEYAGHLSDPAKSLKELDPLVRTIQHQADLVAAKAADPQYATDEIGALATDLALTANVAMLKFQRGDFID